MRSKSYFPGAEISHETSNQVAASCKKLNNVHHKYHLKNLKYIKYLNKCTVPDVPLQKQIDYSQIGGKFIGGTSRCHLSKTSRINLRKIKDWSRRKGKNKEIIT